MDSTVDAMATAYDSLVDATAAAVREPGHAAALEDHRRCLVAFNDSCDHAEDLVQAAAVSLGPAAPHAATSGLDALCHTVHAIEQDLQAVAAADDDQEQKDPAPTPLVAVAAEDTDHEIEPFRT
ncbi:unnamed protein product [Alopecurus aequalis]